MRISRRNAIVVMAGAPALLLPRKSLAQDVIPEIEKGPFDGTREALKAYQVPQWFRDAKFGIWAHWGPQSAAEDGDWYARNIYIQGSPQNKDHVARFGHPSKFGHKDICKMWTADKFDPDHLMQLYKKAGAKYFMSMAVHHDNFDLWDSKHQPRWNSVAMGPKKDIVGLWEKAARKQGLRFAVSEHLAFSYLWWPVSHGSDQTGPMAGVPYDGADPQYADLYHEYSKEFLASEPGGRAGAVGRREAPLAWRQHYYTRIKDLIDHHQPDLLYNDGGIVYPEVGYHLVSHLYNVSAKVHGGKVEAVYTSKGRTDCDTGTCIFDIERGVADQLQANPWQSDTCIGAWHYKRDIEYKTPKRVIDMLCDIVSRNGNLMLNFPLPNSGELDAKELKILDEITRWMAVNSEGIYSTRPWKIFGDGPGTKPAAAPDQRFNENSRKDLTAEDVRFTTKANAMYAFVMGWPGKEAAIPALALGGKNSVPRIRNIELLGHKGKLKWTQDAGTLKVELPEEKPSDYAVTFKIALA
ncbi:MAG: alpha-L-fucosidase [Bryobacteraceae bacterium]|jgi:alpha-L-fucosidase